MSNPYRALLNLLPGRPLLVGTVTAVVGGVATIEMEGGATAQARGDVSASDHVFFRDGLIEGPAPALDLEIIEV